MPFPLFGKVDINYCNFFNQLFFIIQFHFRIVATFPRRSMMLTEISHRRKGNKIQLWYWFNNFWTNELITKLVTFCFLSDLNVNIEKTTLWIWINFVCSFLTSPLYAVYLLHLCMHFSYSTFVCNIFTSPLPDDRGHSLDHGPILSWGTRTTFLRVFFLFQVHLTLMSEGTVFVG